MKRRSIANTCIMLVMALVGLAALWLRTYDSPQLAIHFGAAENAAGMSSSSDPATTSEEVASRRESAGSVDLQSVKGNGCIKWEVQVLEYQSKRPIGGADVEVIVAERLFREKSRADGVASFSLPRGGCITAFVTVSASGFFHARVQLDIRPGAQVMLSRAQSVSGRIFDHDTGRSVANATIALLHPRCRGCAPEYSSSGADGTYILVSSPESFDFRLEVKAAGYPEQAFIVVADDVMVRVPGRRVFDIGMRRGQVMRGYIEDWSTGERISRCDIFDMNSGVGRAAAVSDSKGAFEVQSLKASGRGRLRFVPKSGYCTVDCSWQMQGLVESDVVIKCPKGARIYGVVRDSSGRGIPGAMIRVVRSTAIRLQYLDADPWKAFMCGPLHCTVGPEADFSGFVADTDGGFMTSGWPPLTWGYAVTAEHQGYLKAKHVVQRLGAAGEELRVDLTMEKAK